MELTYRSVPSHPRQPAGSNIGGQYQKL